MKYAYNDLLSVAKFFHRGLSTCISHFKQAPISGRDLDSFWFVQNMMPALIMNVVIVGFGSGLRKGFVSRAKSDEIFDLKEDNDLTVSSLQDLNIISQAFSDLSVVYQKNKEEYGIAGKGLADIFTNNLYEDYQVGTNFLKAGIKTLNDSTLKNIFIASYNIGKYIGFAVEYSSGKMFGKLDLTSVFDHPEFLRTGRYLNMLVLETLNLPSNMLFLAKICIFAPGAIAIGVVSGLYFNNNTDKNPTPSDVIINNTEKKSFYKQIESFFGNTFSVFEEEYKKNLKELKRIDEELSKSGLYDSIKLNKVSPSLMGSFRSFSTGEKSENEFMIRSIFKTLKSVNICSFYEVGYRSVNSIEKTLIPNDCLQIYRG